VFFYRYFRYFLSWQYRRIASRPRQDFGCDRQEKRSGGKNRQLLCGKQRSAVAHSGRVSAVVPHRLPGPQRRAVHTSRGPDNHHVRGERHRQQLVCARETVPANIRLPSSQRPAQSVHLQERGDRVHVPRDRTDRERNRFRRGTRLLPQVCGSGKPACRHHGPPLPEEEKRYFLHDGRSTVLLRLRNTRVMSYNMILCILRSTSGRQFIYVYYIKYRNINNIVEL
jgi:hypothetical protein